MPINSNDETYFDDLDFYEEQFSTTRRQQKVAGRKPKQARADQAGELAETSGLEAGFTTTYVPARFEATWLLSSLQSFYEEHLINDILASVKGGKEASVYRCAAEQVTGVALLAAKVYRPRQFRNLRNDNMYREGRVILTADGRAVKNSDTRLMKAIGKKSALGVQVEHTSWLMYEYTTLERLHSLGGAVPKPYAVNDNALLMGYVGDEQIAAPTLNGVRLEQREATRLFDKVIANIELMLQCGIIHGDLSAYNILYWNGGITLIDFPQVTPIQSNSRAFEILQRDVVRVCEYFSHQGVRCNPGALANDLWERYAAIDPDDAAADASRLQAE